MRTIGMHTSGAKKRYTVGLVIIEDGTVVKQMTIGAPEADGARSLHELYGTLRDLIERHKPQAVTIWKAEGYRGKNPAAMTREAEGVALAVAGAVKDLRVDALARQTVGKQLGLAGQAGAADITDRAQAVLGSEMESPECSYAASAALSGAILEGWTLP